MARGTVRAIGERSRYRYRPAQGALTEQQREGISLAARHEKFKDLIEEDCGPGILGRPPDYRDRMAPISKIIGDCPGSEGHWTGAPSRA